MILASVSSWAQTSPPGGDQTPPGGQPGTTAAPPPPTPPPPPEAPANYPSVKGHELWIGKDIWFRFGAQAQVWADLLQDPITQSNGDAGKYSQNLFIRRARFYMVSSIYTDVVMFINIDSPNLGKTAAGTTGNKSFGPAIVQDLTGEWKVNDYFILGAGEIVIPIARNALQYTSSYWTLDVGNTTAAFSAPTNLSALRDTGFQIRGYALDGALDYRVGVFQGVRDPGAAATMTAPELTASQNAFRIAGYVQYDFFDVEKSYLMFYHGQNFGHKKILGAAVGFDTQDIGSAKPYYGVSASLFADIPLNGPSKQGGDEVGGILQYIRYDGQDSIASLPRQNDILAELGYYNKDISGSVFAKFEMKALEDSAVSKTLGTGGSAQWIGGGVKYFVFENLCNLTLAYNHTNYPDADSTKFNGVNEFTFQFQFFFL